MQTRRKGKKQPRDFEALAKMDFIPWPRIDVRKRFG